MKALYLSLRLLFFACIFLAAKNSIAQSKIVDPVVKVKGRSDKMVSLVWKAYTGDVSQYVLERSTDGKKFVEVSAFFTLSNDEPYYEFDDRFKSSYPGPLYYRLRVEGQDGGMIYAPVTILYAVK
ncbi:MAG: hypothetical protein JNK79_05785 [Chitinophagaceae bacterium]|nr:hypothetical protein [Chitinophagaceae bacterium]